MKKLSIIILIALALMMVAFTILVSQASASTTADDPGIPWGWYTVKERSADLTHYKLAYENKPGEWCEVTIKADCTEPTAPAPKVGDRCWRIGNQKYDCGNGTQILRWTETIIQKCYAYLPKLAKCPPCPVCPAGAGPECISCLGSEQ